MNAIGTLSETVGVRSSCEALGIARASFYRWRDRDPAGAQRVCPSPPRALSTLERDEVLSTLRAPTFVDQAPAAVYASLLDEGSYLCSIRTMYRLLASAGEVRERRDQLRHPRYEVPRLVARAPNQVWSWDITKLLGPQKWTYYYLYVILDIFSRYVVGWMLSERESATLARQLITAALHRQGIVDGELTIHADRGSSMKSKTVALLLADLGVTRSHSRPRVSNDNPFSESQFKTLKTRPEFPDRFGSVQHGREFGSTFFDWYNHEHYHSALGLLTPASVHYGTAEAIVEQRQKVLTEAHQRHPERFVHGRPRVLMPPREVWINRPTDVVLELDHGRDGVPRIGESGPERVGSCAGETLDDVLEPEPAH